MKETNDISKPLLSTTNTIVNYDNKANSLLTAVGIVFGFSIFSISELTNKCGTLRILVIIFGLLYLICFVATIVLLVLIIFPRRRNKTESKNQIDFQCYHEDLYEHLKSKDIEEFLLQPISEESIVDQIKNCSRIAHIKENLLRAATILIMLFSFFLACLVIIAFI